MLVSCVLLNVFFCNFVDFGFKVFWLGGVRGRGLGALGMSTPVGEVCVLLNDFLL